MPLTKNTETNEIMGQFLPKIYTNRITVEDIGNVEDRNKSTSVSVEYHIKDVLNQNGVGIITQTRNDADASEIQNRILSALKIGMVIMKNQSEAISFAKDLYSLGHKSKFFRGAGIRGPAFGDVDFLTALNIMSSTYNLSGKKNDLSIRDARPESIGFEFRNTTFEKLDSNNNVINIIPYKKIYKLDDLEWDRCNNLCLITFTFFDFNELQLSTDGLSNKNAKQLGYMIGDLTLDSILVGGKIQPTARVYRDVETNAPYAGPVHYHSSQNPGPGGYVGYMAGYGGEDMGPRLVAVQVPVTKVQDFRPLQRSKLVNYSPPQLEYFNSKTPGLSYLEKRNKNYFGVENVLVDYDYGNRHTFLDFTVNFRDIYKNNSRYYDLVSQIPLFETMPLNNLIKVSNIKVLRRRVTDRPIGNTKLGAPKRIKYDQLEELDHLVISTAQSQTTKNIISKIDKVGSIIEYRQTIDTRSFQAKDYEISNYHNTDGTYQYGVEVTIIDNTKEFFRYFVELSKSAISSLKRYSEKAKIPVFDTYYIKKSPENLPIGLGADEFPEYVSAMSHGNYDTRTNTFTDKFKREARAEFGSQGRGGFKYYVNLFLNLVQFSFGRSFVSLTKTSVNSVQRDDRLESPLTALQSLDNDGIFNTPDGLRHRGPADEQSLVNMIDPSNARPETIDSFIRSFEDLVLELEKFFDFEKQPGIYSDGSGYVAKGDRSITVKRYFNSCDTTMDEDNFIKLLPYKFHFNYDLGFLSRPEGPRTLDHSTLVNRVASEISRFQADRRAAADEFERGFVDRRIAADRRERVASERRSATEVTDYLGSQPENAPVVLSPRSVVIGSTEVFFGSDSFNRSMSERQNTDSMSVQRTGEQRSKSEILSEASKRSVVVESNDENTQQALGAFIEELIRLEGERNMTQVSSLIRDFDNLESDNLYGGLIGLLDYCSNSSAIYGDDTLPLTAIKPEVEFSINTNQCGIVDNTPPRTVAETIEDLGLVPYSSFGYSQIGNVLGRIRMSQGLSSIAPQINSRLFPSGGPFDYAMKVLTVGGTILNSNTVASLPANTRVNISSLDSITNNAVSTAGKSDVYGLNFGPAALQRKTTASILRSSHGSFRIGGLNAGSEPSAATQQSNAAGPTAAMSAVNAARAAANAVATSSNTDISSAISAMRRSTPSQISSVSTSATSSPSSGMSGGSSGGGGY